MVGGDARDHTAIRRLRLFRGENHSAHQHVRRADGPLERRSPQDGHLGLIAFVVVAFVIGNAVGTKEPAHQDYVGDSGQASKLFDNHYPKKDDEQVIVQAPKGGHATDASVRKAVDETVAAVSGKPGVTDVQSPYHKGNEDQISKDGRSVLVDFAIKGDEDTTQNLVDPTVAAVNKVKAANPGVFVGQFGGASAEKAINDVRGRLRRRPCSCRCRSRCSSCSSPSARSSPRGSRCCSA